jgi:two-component system response regulator DesR
VSGFLSKDASPVDLVAAIRTVHAGRRVLDPELTAFAWTSASKGPLTARELDVLRLVASGTDIGDISRTLFLSSGTVRNYLTQIVRQRRRWWVGRGRLECRPSAQAC